MKPLRRLVSLLFLCALCLPAQEIKKDQLREMSKPELDLVKILLKQEQAWNRGDIDAFGQGYKNSPETIFIGDTITHGFTAVMESYRRSFPTKDAMGTLAFSDIDPHLLDGSFAVVTGHYKLDRAKKFGGPSTGVFSLIFEKTENGWKIILDHTA